MTHHILVVDDSQMVLETVSTILSRAGYTVETAESGDKALKIFSNAPASFDLLLTDLEMPGIDGHELVKKVREHASRHIPAIIYSGTFTQDGYDEKEEVFRLSKPAPLSTLRAYTDRALASAEVQ